MRSNDLYTNKELVEPIPEVQGAIDIVNTPMINDAIRIVNDPAIQHVRQVADVVSEFSKMREAAINCFKALVPENFNEYVGTATSCISDMAEQILSLYSQDLLINTSNIIKGIAENYSLIFDCPDNISDEETFENKELNKRIITEIFRPDEKINKTKDKKESAIVILSPVNSKVLKYLAENPDTLYQLTGREFEEVMAEIYYKLGYNVEITKATKDKGKDIIIRKPEILGDFMYYVECKKYAANRPIGVGLVREFNGVINMDRVNGGILATTSYFTEDARDLILDKNLSYQIQMHDYNKIREMLNRVV